MRETPELKTKSPKQVVKGFRYPVRGLWVALWGEASMRLEIYALIAAIVLGLWRGWSYSRWVPVLIGFTLILGFEAVNTSIEEALRRLHPEPHEKIRNAYDTAATPVLLAFALTIGLAVYAMVWPR